MTCTRCRRPLSRPESVQHGMGPVCWRRTQSEHPTADDAGTVADLPFDGATEDIVCVRDDRGTHFNIAQRITHHSPTGFEWGYGGSGPADFALNVLHWFTLSVGDPPVVKCFDGKCTEFAWRWHQDFKFEFIAKLPREGGTISGKMIRDWIHAKRP